MSEPASKFSKTVATGIRVSLKTQAPLTLPGTLSTAGHCDQSRGAIVLRSFFHDTAYDSMNCSTLPGNDRLFRSTGGRLIACPQDPRFLLLSPACCRPQRPCGRTI